MTLDELIVIVERAYGTTLDRQLWWNVLGTLDARDVAHALDEWLADNPEGIPSPAALRSRVLRVDTDAAIRKHIAKARKIVRGA